MASCFYNGVLLPEIPSDALKNYPYCWIRNNTRTGYYDLMMAKSPWWQSDSTTIYTASYADGIQWYRTPMQNVGDDWTFNQSWTTNGSMADESDRNIIWANQNIPTGAVTATSIYFVGSSAVPDVESYQIKKDTVVAIADQVRRLCKTEATMTPAVIESKLGGLNIELMDLYVTSTTQDVTYNPEEGYYGFSKVVVGGVDFGGGGGSGGGEVIESYPDAEVTTFGSDFVTAPILTGRSYFTYSGKTHYIPAIPTDVLEDYPYCFILYNSNNQSGSNLVEEYQLYCNSKQWVRSGTIMDVGSCVQYRYLIYGEGSENESDAGWVYIKKWTSDFHLSVGIAWSNYDVVSDTGGIYKAGSALIPETEEGIIAQPVEREEIYTISGDTLNAIATAVQQLTGYALMTPSEMAAALNSRMDDE